MESAICLDAALRVSRSVANKARDTMAQGGLEDERKR